MRSIYTCDSISIYQFNTMENKHVSEETSDWQQIHSPYSSISAKTIDENDNSSLIKDDFFIESSVFPPTHHEDLPVSNPEDDNQHLQESEPVHTPRGDGARRWKRLHFGVMKTGIFRFLCKFKNYVACKAGFWLLAWIAGGVATMVLVSFMHRRLLLWWQRRMQLDSSKETLMTMIRDKDKKINHLLLQIAQMNEMLLARRRVSVIRLK